MDCRVWTQNKAGKCRSPSKSCCIDTLYLLSPDKLLIYFFVYFCKRQKSKRCNTQEGRLCGTGVLCTGFVAVTGRKITFRRSAVSRRFFFSATKGKYSNGGLCYAVQRRTTKAATEALKTLFSEI